MTDVKLWRISDFSASCMQARGGPTLFFLLRTKREEGTKARTRHQSERQGGLAARSRNAAKKGEKGKKNRERQRPPLNIHGLVRNDNPQCQENDEKKSILMLLSGDKDFLLLSAHVCHRYHCRRRRRRRRRNRADHWRKLIYSSLGIAGVAAAAARPRRKACQCRPPASTRAGWLNGWLAGRILSCQLANEKGERRKRRRRMDREKEE